MTDQTERATGAGYPAFAASGSPIIRPAPLECRAMDPVRLLAPMPLARGGAGAVVAPHHLATAAGLGILRAGGGAVDAAIATNAVLAVVMGQACGLGGDAFWLVWDEAAGTQTALNGSGRAPAGADPAALRARGLATLPLRGPLTITVPGAVRSWADAHARWGSLPVAALLAPAIELARAASRPTSTSCGRSRRPARSSTRRSGRWRAAGTPPTDRTGGRGASASGFGFRLSGRPSSGSRPPGWPTSTAARSRRARPPGSQRPAPPCTAADLAAHASTWETPLALDYRGVTATTHPPNSSGVTGLEVLNILRALPAPAPADFAPGDGGAHGRPGPALGPRSGSRRRSARSPTATRS